MTMQERYQDVKDFWLKQSPARQKELLRVPIRLLLQGSKQHTDISNGHQRLCCCTPCTYAHS